jgi:hypothetical protein
VIPECGRNQPHSCRGGIRNASGRHFGAAWLVTLLRPRTGALRKLGRHLKGGFIDGYPGWRYFSIMSTVKDVKAATQALSSQERWELYRWLGESKDVQQFRHEELRREIAIGIEQVERGNIAPLNIDAIKTEVHRKSKNRAN